MDIFESPTNKIECQNIFKSLTLDPLGKGYHIIQSKIAIGSGGLKWQWFSRGFPK